MDILLALTLLGAAFYVGWNIGANDAANCIGTTVGAQVLPFRTVAMIMAFFVILGSALPRTNSNFSASSRLFRLEAHSQAR